MVLGRVNMLVIIWFTFNSIFMLVLLNVFLVLSEDFLLHRVGQIIWWVVLRVHRLTLLRWINVRKVLRSGNEVIGRSCALARDWWTVISLGKRIILPHTQRKCLPLRLALWLLVILAGHYSRYLFTEAIIFYHLKHFLRFTLWQDSLRWILELRLHMHLDCHLGRHRRMILLGFSMGN